MLSIETDYKEEIENNKCANQNKNYFSDGAGYDACNDVPNVKEEGALNIFGGNYIDFA